MIFFIYKGGSNEYCLPVDDKEEGIDTELEMEDFISSFDEDNGSVDEDIDDFRELLDT